MLNRQRATFSFLASLLLGLAAVASIPAVRFEAKFAFADFVNVLFQVPFTRSLIEAQTGTADVPDVEPMYSNPLIDVSNGKSETATVSLPEGQYILIIGSPFSTGNDGPVSRLGQWLDWEISELSSVIRTDIDADDDDNDALQIVKEIVDGRGGSKYDVDHQPGIDGVQLVGLSPTRYTLKFDDHGEFDFLTLEGPGVEAVLQELDSPARLGDGVPTFSLVDLATESIELGGALDPTLNSLIGKTFEVDSDIQALWGAAIDPDFVQVELISQEQNSFAIRVNDSTLIINDYLVFYDSSATFDFHFLEP